MTVVPLFCAKFISNPDGHQDAQPASHPVDGPEASVVRSVARRRTRRGPERFNAWFNRGFEAFLDVYDRWSAECCGAPGHLLTFSAAFASSLLVFPLLGLSFFPRTDAGQFVINVKAPSGTRLDETEKEIATS